MLCSDSSLIELQSRSDSEYISHSRTVLITDRKGWVSGNSDQGLWIYKGAPLSRSWGPWVERRRRSAAFFVSGRTAFFGSSIRPRKIGSRLSRKTGKQGRKPSKWPF